MSTEKMRDEFKAWHSDQVARLLEHGEPTAAKVWRDFESLLWSTWQASRADIEVELPQRMRRTSMCMPQEDIADMTIWNRAIDASQSAIESLGLKVKP